MENSFFGPDFVLFVVEYFPVFSNISLVSRLKIPSKSFPLSLLRQVYTDYKNCLK